MPPHQPGAAHQPVISIWHPTEVPPYRTVGALQLGTTSSLGAVPSAISHDQSDAAPSATHSGAASSLAAALSYQPDAALRFGAAFDVGAAPSARYRPSFRGGDSI